MFGYVKVFKPTIRMGEYEIYKGIYCTLCKRLGKRYGVLSRFTLSYDMTFLALLQMALAEECGEFCPSRCSFNPTKRCLKATDTVAIDRAADIGTILAYYKLKDTLADEGLGKKIGALCAALDSLYPGRPIIGVMGMMNRKDYRSSVPQLAKRCRVFIAVPAADDLPQIVPPEVIAEIAREHCNHVRVCASPEEGARLAVRLAAEEDVLVATGSMYLLSGAKIGFTAE